MHGPGRHGHGFVIQVRGVHELPAVLAQFLEVLPQHLLAGGVESL